jgi:hypothetical protein
MTDNVKGFIEAADVLVAALRAEIANLKDRIATQAEMIQVWSGMLDDMDTQALRIQELERAGRDALEALEISGSWGAAKRLRKALDKGMP